MGIDVPPQQRVNAGERDAQAHADAAELVVQHQAGVPYLAKERCMKWKLIKLITTYYKAKRSWNQKSSKPCTGLRTELTHMTEADLQEYGKRTYFDARNAEDIFSTVNNGKPTSA